MITTPYLKTGDKIRIVSPAGKVKEKYIMPAVEWLQDQGYRVELGKYVFAGHLQFAGTDQQRREDLQTALDDPDTTAIICSRGGYGTIHLLDKLNCKGIVKHPKWIVGFSDITILHSWMNRIGIATIHGVMPRHFLDSEGNPGESLQSLMNLLTGNHLTYTIPATVFDRKGKVTARLTGGNLSIISSLQGTIGEIDTDGKILFLEDVNEYLYHTDRMMHQLKLSGKLGKLAGLVLGMFTEMKDNESPFGKNIQEIISEAVEEYDFPVCYNFPAGHYKRNLALALGNTWELHVNEKQSELKLIANSYSKKNSSQITQHDTD